MKSLVTSLLGAFLLLNLIGCASTPYPGPDRRVASEPSYDGLAKFLESHYAIVEDLEATIPFQGDPRRLLIEHFKAVYFESKSKIDDLIREENEWSSDPAVIHNIKRIKAAYRALNNLGIYVRASTLVDFEDDKENENAWINLDKAMVHLNNVYSSALVSATPDYIAEAYLEIADELLNQVRDKIDSVKFTRSRVRRLTVKKGLKKLQKNLRKILAEKEKNDSADLTGIHQVKDRLAKFSKRPVGKLSWMNIKNALKDVSVSDSSSINGLDESLDNAVTVMLGFDLFKTIVEGENLKF